MRLWSYVHNAQHNNTTLNAQRTTHNRNTSTVTRIVRRMWSICHLRRVLLFVVPLFVHFFSFHKRSVDQKHPTSQHGQPPTHQTNQTQQRRLHHRRKNRPALFLPRTSRTHVLVQHLGSDGNRPWTMVRHTCTLQHFGQCRLHRLVLQQLGRSTGEINYYKEHIRKPNPHLKCTSNWFWS